MASIIGCDTDEVLRVSAKTGDGVPALLDQIVAQVPAPVGESTGATRALIFDSVYDAYRGVVTYIRVVDGEIKHRDRILMMSTNATHEVLEVGVISPDRMRMDSVMAGRWARNDLIQTAETAGVCAGSANYDFLLLALNDMLDVRSNRSTAGPDVECDALSMALPSTGYRAHFAGLATGDPVPNQCEGM